MARRPSTTAHAIWPYFPESYKKNKSLEPVGKAQTAIETAAQSVLDVRAKFQAGAHPATLADLYDPLTMPPELLKVYPQLDAAVDYSQGKIAPCHQKNS